MVFSTAHFFICYRFDWYTVPLFEFFHQNLFDQVFFFCFVAVVTFRRIIKCAICNVLMAPFLMQFIDKEKACYFCHIFGTISCKHENRVKMCPFLTNYSFEISFVIGIMLLVNSDDVMIIR